MAEQHLDPGVYGAYRQVDETSLEGAHVKWIGIPPTESGKIMPLIIEQAALWMERFNVALEVAPDQSHVYLDLRYRKAPTPAMVRNLKGEVASLKIATSWGGP